MRTPILTPLAAVALALVAPNSFAQSPVAMTTVARGGVQTPPGLHFMSSANPWVGAQVAYKFPGTKEAADNVVVTGYLYHMIPLGTDRFQLPVRGNVAALPEGLSGATTAKDTLETRVNSMITSNEGISVGLYPYYWLRRNETVSLVPNAVVGWKVNAFTVATDDVEYINQMVTAIAFEALIGRNEADRLTVSLCASWNTPIDEDAYERVFQKEKETTLSGEVTAVVPIGGGLGGLFEWAKAEGNAAVFRVSVIGAREVKSGD